MEPGAGGNQPGAPGALMEEEHLDCLLAMCPPWDTTQPPINIAYLASYARNQGFRVAAWDLNIKLHKLARTTELQELWDAGNQNIVTGEEVAQRYFDRAGAIVKGFVRRITTAGAPVVGFSVHSRNVHFTVRLVEELRAARPELKIIFGGPEISISHMLGSLGRLNADAYAVGDGEQTLVDALAAWREHGELRAVPGMILAHDDSQELELRKKLLDLDDLPFPSWDEFDLTWYDQQQIDPTLPFLFSRGCTGQCRFCMDFHISGRFRSRSAKNAVDEMEAVIRRHGVNHFYFSDLICNGNPKRLKEFAELVVQRGLDIGWWSYAVVRRGLDLEFFAALKKSGCSALVFGLESGSSTTLKLMNKYYNAEQAEEVLAACAGAGINTGINIIVGFPGETRVEHEETLAFVERNRANIHRVVNLGTCLVSPGTALHLRPEDFGLLQDEERGTWYTEDGNTIEERNRRLNEVEALLTRLGIPRIVINRELGLDAYTVEEGETSETRSVEQPVRIYDVRFLDIAEEERQEFETGEYMTVLMRFRIAEPVENPLVRFQIFNDQNPEGRNFWLFGMNNDRVNVHFGKLEPGKLEIRLNIYELNLLPGRYKVTLGIWPSDDAPVAFDVRHGSTVFDVAGALKDRSGAKAAMNCSWRRLGEVTADAGQQPRLGEIILTDREGVDLEAFMTRDRVCARFDCALANPSGIELRVTLEQDGVPVHRAFMEDTELAPGRQTLELTYDALLLLKGDYMLAAELVQRGTGEVVARQDRPLRLDSVGGNGAGIIHMPTSWEIAAKPFAK